MKFLVCDDNKASVDSISKLLYSLCQKHNISVTIDTYIDANKLLCKELNEYNVAFLDVMMDTPGINIAEHIVENSPDTIIVFISSYIEYAPEGYHVNAFRYILKTDLDRTLSNCFDDLIKEINKRKKYLSIRSDGEFENIPTDLIVYVQSDQRVLYFCLDRTYRIVLRSYLKMSDIAEELEPKGFIRIHKSYLINLNYIDHLDSKTVFLKTGQEFSVGESFRNSVLRTYVLWRGQ